MSTLQRGTRVCSGSRKNGEGKIELSGFPPHMKATLRELDATARLSKQHDFVIVCRRGDKRDIEIERVRSNRFVYRVNNQLIEDKEEILITIEYLFEILFSEAFDRSNAKEIGYQTFTALDLEG